MALLGVDNRVSQTTEHAVFVSKVRNMQSEIGLAIKLARVAVGKSQWQVAAKVGIHPSILNLIENGRRTPNPELAKSVLEELGIGGPHTPLASLVLQARRIEGGMK